jgi:hypothetical protein
MGGRASMRASISESTGCSSCDQELQVPCRRRDFRLRKAIDKFVQLLFAGHRAAPPPLKEFYRGEASRRGRERSLEFIAANFRNTAGAGYVTACSATDAAYRPQPERDENVALARAANAAWRASGDAKSRRIAEEAMRYVVTPQVARAYTAAPTLLADAELTAAY